MMFCRGAVVVWLPLIGVSAGRKNAGCAMVEYGAPRWVLLSFKRDYF